MEDAPNPKVIRIKCGSDVREIEVATETETEWTGKPTYVDCAVMKWPKKTWVKIQEGYWDCEQTQGSFNRTM